MEAIEELLIPSISESTKVGVVSGETEPVAMELDVCHKSNGVADSTEAGYSESDGVVSQSDARDSIVCDQRPAEENVPAGTSVVEGVEETAASLGSDIDLLAAISETASAVENLLGNSNPSETSQEITEEIVENHEEIVSHGAEIILEESTVEMDHVESETVTFTTEILVEKNDYHSSVDPIVQQEVVTSEQETTNNILNDLGHGIELSEALRSSDTADNAENNNCTTREEVFNKEELLDILEGNDMTQSDDHSKETKHTNSAESKKNIEAQMAWKQLSKLKQTRNCRPKRKVERTPTIRKKRDCKKERISDSENSNSKENSEKTDKNSHMQDEDTKTVVVEKDKNKSIVNNEKDKNVSIVNKLVEDWDDDEPPEADQTTLDVSDKLDEACNDLVKSLEAVTSQEVITTTCSLTTNDQTVNVKSEDESQPQRRLGRVIKKKVIFDPDNPDTFTKGKVVAKTKETNPEKEQPPPKKIKSEEITQRSKSKSPMSKMQWKKPQPKINSKQNKTRLTEVDKLLMDEGAVNMIYQLTPEAPKGKKNMRTKAEFIKKIQSSTPEGKEGSRFRERKKEVKMEESEAKKILGGKQRSSLSSSVKSPAACEDFENISADDSIIYRRHSSSSYSSTCMSPRRLSDVDAGALQSVAKASQQAADTRDTTLEATIPNQSADIFMADANSSAAEIINKDDCLSIKEKLNTKLSQALKKRKRDSTKIEKTPKLKRVIKTEEKDSLKNKDVGGFNHLTIRFNQRLAQICIMKKFSNVEAIIELEQAISFIETQKDVSVTLLTSETGSLCSDLDMTQLLDNSTERRTNNAYELAESVRSLLSVVDAHSKLLVCGVGGECVDLSLALVALSDVTLASERATFGLSALPRPGAAALTTRSTLSQALVNDLIMFSRQLSATEALQSGLVSRTLWPGNVDGQMFAIARDLAAKPTQSILLKKQLLRLKKRSESETFLLSLEKERDLLVEYWISVEGQDELRATTLKA